MDYSKGKIRDLELILTMALARLGAQDIALSGIPLSKGDLDGLPCRNSYNVLVLDQLEQEGFLRYLPESRTLELTDMGIQFGDHVINDLGIWLNQYYAPPSGEHPPGSRDSPGLPPCDGDGEPARDDRVFRLRITLELERLHTCWREVAISAASTFLDLHIVIQRIFNWYDEHLFNFRLQSGDKLLHLEEACFYDPTLKSLYPHGYSLVEADALRLGDVFPETKAATYEYDYGYGWNHTIKPLETLTSSRIAGLLPQLVAGEGDAPPEDVGGIAGYGHFLQALAGPRNAERSKLITWAKSQGYHPFNLASKQRELTDWFTRDRELWDARIQEGL